MIKQAIFYTTVIFIILIIQFIISYFFSKEKNKSQFKENLIPLIGASLFIGIMFSLISKIFSPFNLTIISFILMASIISSYWFIINPLKYLFGKNIYFRDSELENEMKSEGHNYKILFTDQITTNAYATGIIPFSKIIIVGKSLKEKLSKTQLKAIIYHEIGHHKKRHILILFFVNVILQTIFFLMFLGIYRSQFKTGIMEPVLVAIAGGFGGFLFWIIPGKISFYLEYQADKYSAVHYNKKAIIDSLIKIDEISGGKLSKGNSNHPNLEKRLNNLVKNESL